MTDNIIDKINSLRAKVRDGEELTREEAREALNLMREQRKNILDAQVKKDQAKVPSNLNDLFN